MKSRPVILLSLALGAAALCALAYALRPAPEPPAVVASAPERLRLEHRLADADAVLVRSATGEQTRRLDVGPRLSIVGGAEAPADPHHVRLEKVISETPARREHEDCGGTLMAGGWIVTAAHCVSGRWLYLDAHAGQTLRGGPAWARWRIGEAAVHRYYEGCGEDDDACRHDVALIRLPDDPGFGAPWPQTAQTQLEPGEVVRICGHGLTAARTTSEALRCVEMPVLWARAGILRLDGASGAHFDQGDSGGGVSRSATGTLVAVVSHIVKRLEGWRFYVMPFPTAWAAEVKAAWAE